VNRLAVVALLALAACKPYLSAQSPAPPGRVAHLERVDGFWGLKRYKLELSSGVALAVGCYRGGPCHDLGVEIADPRIVEARPAAFDVLVPRGYVDDKASALVLVGKQPGTTQVRVTSREGARTIAVTVVAPPPPRNAMTAATAAP